MLAVAAEIGAKGDFGIRLDADKRDALARAAVRLAALVSVLWQECDERA
jgi:hypothetical protein